MATTTCAGCGVSLPRLRSPGNPRRWCSEWERGVHKPNDHHMAQIAEALDKPVAWFYGESEAKPPDLMASFNGSGASPRLARIEAKLDLIARALAAGDSVSDPAGLAQALEDLAGQDEQHEREHEEDADDDASEAQGG